MRIFPIIALIAAFLFSPSAPAQSIDQAKVDRVKLKISDTTDRFTGTRKIGPPKALYLAKTGIFTEVALTPAILVIESNAPIFYAGIYYSGFGWAFLNGTVYFIVDGQRFVATGTDSSRNRSTISCSGPAGCMVEELERILISRELAAALANAKEGEVKVTSSNGALIGRLTEKHVAYFRELVARYAAMGGTYPAKDGSLGPLPSSTNAPPKSPVSAPVPEPIQ